VSGGRKVARPRRLMRTYRLGGYRGPYRSVAGGAGDGSRKEM
jgi:hypothetical protein